MCTPLLAPRASAPSPFITYCIRLCLANAESDYKIQLQRSAPLLVTRTRRHSRQSGMSTPTTCTHSLHALCVHNIHINWIFDVFRDTNEPKGSLARIYSGIYALLFLPYVVSSARTINFVVDNFPFRCRIRDRYFRQIQVPTLLETPNFVEYPDH
jgi:hypothetical protein